MTPIIDPSTITRLKDLVLFQLDKPVFFLDLKLKLIWVNKAGSHLVGIDGPDLIERRISDIDTPLYQSDALLAAINDAKHDKVPVNLIISTELGVKYKVRVIPDTDGTILIVDRVSIPNFTEVDYQALVNIIGSPTLVIDSDQRIRHINDAAIELLGGQSYDTVIGQHCYDLFHRDGRPPVHCPFLTLLSTGKNTICEVESLGRVYSVAVTALDESATPRNILHIATDITAHQLAEDASRLYLDILAHDVANHLQIILLGVSSLVENLQDEIVLMVFNSIDKISRLIAKARSIEGLETSSLSPVVLQDIIGLLIGEFESKYPSVLIDSALPIDDCIVLANDYLLELLTNLIDNGIRYNPHAQKTIWIRIDESQGGIEVIISDNGIGINDDMKRSLLNGKRRFGGVGFHQAKIIARRFGARLRILDRIRGHPEEGAMVSIWFPRAS